MNLSGCLASVRLKVVRVTVKSSARATICSMWFLIGAHVDRASEIVDGAALSYREGMTGNRTYRELRVERAAPRVTMAAPRCGVAGGRTVWRDMARQPCKARRCSGG